MDRQDFMGLYESYMGVYEQDEYFEEEQKPLPKEKMRKQADRALESGRNAARRGDEDEVINQRKRYMGISFAKKKNDPPEAYRTSPLNNSYDYDLYDLVLEYLLDEGLCESVENAEIMMAHMSEGWVDSIIDEATKTVMSVTSPTGKQRKLNTTRATGPARELTYGDRHSAIRTAEGQKRSREAVSFTPEAERNARTRSQEQISQDRQGDVNRRADRITRRLQRKYEVPNSALDPKERSQGIPFRSVDLR